MVAQSKAAQQPQLWVMIQIYLFFRHSPPREANDEKSKRPIPGLDSGCPSPFGILSNMHNNTHCQGTGVESKETGAASVLASHIKPSAFDVQRSAFDVPPAPVFDELKARQSRADLIAFTKAFFGLNEDCA
jgi:hypothetical protein